MHLLSSFPLLLVVIADVAAPDALDLRDIVFYPKDRTNEAQVYRIIADLQAIRRPDNLFISPSRYLDKFYSLARITKAHAEAFAATHPGIATWRWVSITAQVLKQIRN